MMTITHDDFQLRCKVVAEQEVKHPSPDMFLVALMEHAIACSKECCELAKVQPAPPDFEAALEKAWKRHVIRYFGGKEPLSPEPRSVFNEVFRAGFDAGRGTKE